MLSVQREYAAGVTKSRLQMFADECPHSAQDLFTDRSDSTRRMASMCASCIEKLCCCRYVSVMSAGGRLCLLARHDISRRTYATSIMSDHPQTSRLSVTLVDCGHTVQQKTGNRHMTLLNLTYIVLSCDSEFLRKTSGIFNKWLCYGRGTARRACQ